MQEEKHGEGPRALFWDLAPIDLCLSRKNLGPLEILERACQALSGIFLPESFSILRYIKQRLCTTKTKLISTTW